jgi:RNA polymerase sigma-70 factor, ECF subfamily
VWQRALEPETPRGIAATADEDLIIRVRRRDEAALGAIYDRYGRLVYTIALRITGDRESAEEVVQDTFQAVWQSAATFQPGASLVAWLIGIARHRAIDATRSRRFRARAREEVLDDARVGSRADGAAETLVLRETVRRALDDLPAAQRQTIALAYYGGLSCTEIAAQLGDPLGTVKSRLRGGMLRLRELLGSEDWVRD